MNPMPPLSMTVGSNERYFYDWAGEMAATGATSIESSVWTVVAGGAQLCTDGRDPGTDGSISVTYVDTTLSVPWERTQLNNSVKMSTGEKLNKTFTLVIRPGAYHAPETDEAGALAVPLDTAL